jgi:type IV secretory pathway VirB6-like protein
MLAKIQVFLFHFQSDGAVTMHANETISPIVIMHYFSPLFIPSILQIATAQFTEHWLSSIYVAWGSSSILFYSPIPCIVLP